jgi:hypothetical protein
MNAILLKALIGFIIVSALLVWSAQRLLRRFGLGEVVQTLGALGFLIVILAHVCEALRLFSSMGWGRPSSAGHYLDLAGAAAGLSLVPIGYMLSRSHPLLEKER